MHLGLASRERCIKNPALKSEDLVLEKQPILGKCLPFEKISGKVLCEKNLYPGPHLASITSAS